MDYNPPLGISRELRADVGLRNPLSSPGNTLEVFKPWLRHHRLCTAGTEQRPCGTRQRPPEPTGPKRGPDSQIDPWVLLPPGQPAEELTHVRLCLVLFYQAKRAPFTPMSVEKTRAVPLQPDSPQAVIQHHLNCPSESED